MKIIYTITFLLISTISWSQQISRSVLTSSGDYSTNEKGTYISWTIGEIFSESIINAHHITAGFQQGHLVPTPASTTPIASVSTIPNNTELLEDRENSIHVLTYPNPTVNRLTLRFGVMNITSLTAKIFDIRGREVLTQTIDTPSGRSINVNRVSTLSAGTYLIKLIQDGKTITSKKIIKA